METSVRSDSIAKELKWPAAYETPFEADMLIIHDKYDNGRFNLLFRYKIITQN